MPEVYSCGSPPPLLALIKNKTSALTNWWHQCDPYNAKIPEFISGHRTTVTSGPRSIKTHDPSSDDNDMTLWVWHSMPSKIVRGLWNQQKSIANGYTRSTKGILRKHDPHKYFNVKILNGKRDHFVCFQWRHVYTGSMV